MKSSPHAGNNKNDDQTNSDSPEHKSNKKPRYVLFWSAEYTKIKSEIYAHQQSTLIFNDKSFHIPILDNKITA